MRKMDTVTEILLQNKKTKSNRTQALGCNFIRIDPYNEDFDIFKTINEILRHIKQSTKKTVINKISTKLLGLEFTYIVRKILSD